MGKNKKGFTLAELLIVVAIIGVLVAISIPVFTAQLDRAKIAVDQANVRSAKAAALAEWMTSGMNEEKKYYYDAGRGGVTENPAGITGYGKYTKSDKQAEIGATGTPNRNGNAQYLTLIVHQDGSTDITWGESYGTTWRTVAQGAGNSSVNDWDTNRDLKQTILNIDNAQRIASDQDVLNAIAYYFESLSASEVKAVLGDTKYRNSKGGTQLFAYAIDNNSASIRLDYVGNDVSYLEAFGYSTTTSAGKPMVDGLKQNYMTEYVFTSDNMIGPDQITGREHSIRIQLSVDESSDKVTHARIWVNGEAELDSDKSR